MGLCFNNFKSSLFKFCKNLIQYTTRSILSLVCKLKEDDNILISSATHSPWIRDKKFKLEDNLINLLEDSPEIEYLINK